MKKDEKKKMNSSLDFLQSIVGGDISKKDKKEILKIVNKYKKDDLSFGKELKNVIKTTR